MKGIVFNQLEEFVVTHHSEEIWYEILGSTILKTKEPFVGPGTYSDEDLVALVFQTSNRLGLSIEQTLRMFGRWLFPNLANLCPHFVNTHQHPKTFLKSIEDIIHVEIRKMYKDSAPPQFSYKDSSPDTLVMTYYSERKLYSLVEGLLDGVADYFNTSIEHTYELRMENGYELADFDLTFSK